MADNESDPEISISMSGDMTRDGMSNEHGGLRGIGITDEHSDSSSSILYANDTTPTNSNSISVCVSKSNIIDQIIDNQP